MQRNARVADEIAQGFNAVVADAVWNEQGLFVADSHEAGRVPARRAVGTFGPPSRNRHVRRRFDKGAVLRNDAIGIAGERDPARLTADTLERFQARNEPAFAAADVHLPPRPTPAQTYA